LTRTKTRARWARQVAWQVEKNLSAGGKTVYFKTSPSWDVSGEKLLGLFADVINLLPVDARSRVTFSTYPVSLPGGTVCHLRGVHDRDRLFDAASETQAWVDCENARIVHAEMLPTSGSSRKTVVAGGRAAAQGASVPLRGSPEASRLGVRRPVATDGVSRSYGSLVAPRQKGPDMFIVTLVAVGAAVLLVAGVLFSWMIWQNRRQMENSGAAAAVEAEIKNLESEKEQQDRLAEEQRKAAHLKALERKAREDAAAQERAAREAQDAREAEKKQRDIEKEKAKKDAEAEAAAALEKTTKEAEERKRLETSFVSAHVEGKGTPPKPKVGSANASDEPESFKVYYYSDGGVTLTNEVAGFKPMRDPVNRKKALDYSLYVREPKCKLELIGKSPVVLWMSKGRVWFDWGQRMAKREPWFAESESHDLQKDCFGSSEAVFGTWSKAFAVTYLVSWGEEKGQSVEWKEREFKLGDAVDVVYKSKLASLKKAIEDAKKKIDDNEEKIKNVNEGVLGLNKEVARYDSATNTLHQLESQQESLKKQLDGLKGDEKKRLKKARREKGKEIERQKGKVNEIGIDDIERQLKDKKNELDSLEKFAQSLAKKHEEAQQAYKQALEDPNREGRVRECSFSVVVKGAS